MREKIEKIVHNLARHANSLIHDVDTNVVESINAIICKYIGAKRINFCNRRSYGGRCHVAVVAKNTKRPISNVLKRLKNSRKMYINYIEDRNIARSHIRISKKLQKRRRKKQGTTDESYGEHCQKPDMSDGEFENEKNEYLKKIELSPEEIVQIEIKTRNQGNSMEWRNLRRQKLTASNFGDVCRRQLHTPCKNIVRRILYPKKIDTESLRYGRRNEKRAIEALEREIGVNITPSGLFIHEKKPYFAATPDGLVNSDGIIEIKCPYSARNLTPDEGIEKRQITMWKRDGSLNKNHKWFYQVQGQLEMSGREYCIFCIWTPKGIKYEIINRDRIFWEENMEPKLELFYKNCMLPEIIDPRDGRSMDIREPQYILDAIKKKQDNAK